MSETAEQPVLTEANCNSNANANANINADVKENLLSRPLSSTRDNGGKDRNGDRDQDRGRRQNNRDRSRSRDRDHHNDRNHRGPHRNDRPDRRRDGRDNNNNNAFPYYKVVNAPPDEQLGNINDDPRGNDPTKRITKKASSRGNGRNTESFDPASTLVRPDLRICMGSNSIEQYNKPLKHDDVVMVPELFGAEDNWDTYYKLVNEVRELQKKEKENEGRNSKNNKSDWIPWHEGAHLIAKDVTGSQTYQDIIDKLCKYFHIDTKKDVGTRFNWYRDSSDWKPFHHDSAAFNPRRAKNQNITIGASFGASRELAFIRAKEYAEDGEKCRLYFPQVNNGVFSFGRDANILWKHGINALPPSEQDGKGRISIILWGYADKVIEENGSPPLLGSDGRGPHAGGGRGRGGGGRFGGRGGRGRDRGGRGRRDLSARGGGDRDHRERHGHPQDDIRRQDDDRRYHGDGSGGHDRRENYHGHGHHPQNNDRRNNRENDRRRY